MVAIPLGITDYKRDAAKTWPIFLQNMFLEKDPANGVDGMARLGRPALVPFLDVTADGDSACRGLYRHAGVFGGDYLAAFQDTLYRVAVDATGAATPTTLGAINDAADLCIFAASSTRALVATGDPCFSTDGAALTQINMPSGESVSSVAYMDGYFILTVADSQHFFWLAPGDVDPDALNFASVENSPGNLQIVMRFQDELWFFKEQSIEVWQATGDLDAPFVRIGGRLFERGTCNKNTVRVLDNTLYWVGDDLVLYRASASPLRFSDHGLEERMRQAGAEALSGFVFALDGHTFYALRLEGIGTFVLDVESGTSFAHWYSYGEPTWRAIVAAQNGNQVIAGDDSTRTLWLVDPTQNRDAGNVPIQRAVYGVLPIVGLPLSGDCVRIVAATGRTADVNAEPFMELNFTDQQVGDFEFPWYEISLGKMGDYSIITEARQLGILNPPGCLFALRCSDDVPFRISYARLNED